MRKEVLGPAEVVALSAEVTSLDSQKTQTRRLAAIMFTDLVGFTKLAQRDEETALHLRKEHQSLVRPLFVAHGGREVKSMGDGFLVEFSSAVESVRCAVEIQEAVTRRNALPSLGERMVLRIGIHVGDVVGEGDDILGDAVNVASRIEPLAEPGGICVSGSVFDQVRNKLALPLEKIGSRPLKNVDFPVDLYRVVLARDERNYAAPTIEVGAYPRLAVLPFANMSVDAGDEYFADGLTDELISRASQIPSVRVIARTSVGRYKGSTKSIRDVGQELGVGVALEGSVRKAGNRVRITVQLVDARSEEHLWSSRYDRPFDDIFAIQDDIAGQIATSLSNHFSAARGEPRPAAAITAPDTHDMDAYASFLHGKKLLGEKTSEPTIRQALALFQSAVERDPQFARARVGIAECEIYLGAEGAAPFLESIRIAKKELAEALAQNDSLAEGHSVLAGLMVGEDQMILAEQEARRATELNPSLADPYRWLAQLAAGEGKIDETVRLLEEAQRLDPFDVNILAFLGRAYFYAGREAEALAHWKETKSLATFRTNAYLAEYHLSRREFDSARLCVNEMGRIRPNSVWTDTYRGILAAMQGDREGARRCIARLQQRAKGGELTVLFEGFIHLAMGEIDAFVDCMEQALQLHSLPLLELMYSPLCESARQDPRVLDILRRQYALRKAS
ncbi:MAG: adenylate/guanylate cyclase domain-containing protein [Thermoplasmata archaeon]